MGVAFEKVPIHNYFVALHKLFCINLSKRRESAGLTQQEMAEKLDILPRKYQAYEYAYKTGGRPWPRPERIEEFARILECKPSDFFKEIKGL